MSLSRASSLFAHHATFIFLCWQAQLFLVIASLVASLLIHLLTQHYIGHSYASSMVDLVYLLLASGWLVMLMA